MSRTLAHRFASLGAVALMASTPVLVTAAPAEAVSLICRASMSDSTPGQYSNVYVRVKTGKPYATVRTVAHYKTTNTAYTRKSNGEGRASVRYYTASSTPGFKVKVDVTVTKNGVKRSCSTSFTAHR